MIHVGRFSEFVGEFISTYNEETEEKAMWEFWLHKVWDMNYKEFLDKSKRTSKGAERPSQEVLKETVMESRDILNSFCPS